MEGITTTGVPVWLVGVALSALFIAQVFPRLLGPIGTGLDAWATRRRQAAVAKDDADIADRDRQLIYLQAQRAEDHAYRQAHDAVLVAHAAWDREQLDRCQPDTPPPPLWPTLGPVAPPAGPAAGPPTP